MRSNTAKARLARLDAGRIAEAKTTAREAAVLEIWPDSVPVYSVCVHPHHVSVSINDTDPASIPAMLRALPPVPTTLIKGTFTSFKPSAEITDKESEEAKEETPIYPVTVALSGSIEAGHSYDGCTARWFTRLAGESVEVHAELKRYAFAGVSADVTEYKGRGYNREPAAARFIPSPGKAPLGPVQIEKSIRWSFSGPLSYSFTLYWPSLVPDDTKPGSPAEIWKSNIYPMTEAGEEQAEV